MYILSGKPTKIGCLLIGLILFMNGIISAQTYPVKIDITVMPPFTSAIADYIYTPNKIIATISNLGMSNSDVDLYLQGSIISDGGIEIKTSESFKPSNSIHLSSGMVYSLTSEDISNMFDVNMLDVKGIDINDLINGVGLPEDNYQICIRAYDYYTNQPISDEEPLGCSNYFMVTNLEAPFITIPFCGDSISMQSVQNVMVSWTIPAGAIGSQYRFEMIEIPDGMHMNPNNAFESSAFPPFYDEMLSVNIINLTTAKVMLTPGYTYAFRVQAIDPFGQKYFRNNGFSEVCHFIWKEEDKFDFNTLIEDVSLNDFEDQFKLIPSTTISGRLLAKFPDDPNSGIISANNNSFSDPIVVNSAADEIDLNPPTSSSNLQVINSGHNAYSYNEVSMIGSSITTNSSSNKTSAGSSAIVGINNVSTGMIQVTQREPYYYYGQTEEIVNTKPLANVKVRLVARFATNTGGAQWGIGSPQYRDPNSNELVQGITDLEGAVRNPNDIINVVLATATTEESGDFTFNFTADFFTGNSAVSSMGPGHFEEDQYQTNPLDELDWRMNELFPGFDFNGLGDITSQQFGGLINQDQVDMGNQHSNTGQQTMSYTPGETSNYSAYMCLKIEVVNEKFCSPDIDIFAMPGDVLDVPTQVAKLKTYNLTVTPTSSEDDYQLIKKGTPMENVRVHIFRDMQTIEQELDLIVDYEGQKLKTQTINNDGAFKDVAIDTTAIGSGSVSIKNLVKHAYFNPQYFMKVSTRNKAESDEAYEFTYYNYETIYENLETNNETDATYVSSSVLGGTWHTEYNRNYVIPEVQLTPVMVPKWPEIKGRAMALSNIEDAELSNVKVQLFNDKEKNSTYDSALDFQLQSITNSDIVPERETESLDNGFFSFDNLHLLTSENSIVGPYRRILLTHPSYKSEIRPMPGSPPWNLSRGMLKDIKDVNMEPARLIEGYVVDEEGNPVNAYIKTEYSPFYTTKAKQYNGVNHQFFELPSVFIGKNLLFIHPKSSQYFKRDTVIGSNINSNYKITVYKKLHRPKILITNESGSPISGAKVELGEETAKTTSTEGIVGFKYASPGDQVIIKITPPAGYAPIQEPMNIPVTPFDTLFTFVLEYGRTIEGTITEKDSHEPIHGAIVYAELENTNGTILYVEASSNSEGKYMLTGIPKSFSTVEVFSIKKGEEPSYIGDSKTINFTADLATMIPKRYNFELRRMDDWDLSSIWGYPIALNGLRPVKTNPDEYFIDGYFYSPPVTDGFSLQEPNVKLPFNYLRVKKSASGKIEPIESEIQLDVNQIPLVINQTFSGILYNHKQVSWGIGNGLVMNSYGLHKIIKQNDKAVMQGILKLNLSSFNFAYNFNGELYAGNKNLGNKVEAFSVKQTALQTQISAEVVMQTQAQKQSTKAIASFMPRLEIFSLNGALQPIPIKNYEVFNFEATSLQNGAHLVQDKIWIPTILHTDIPTCNTCPDLDLNIYAGNIIVTKTDINLVKTPSDTLNFQLENWKVYNQKEWEFDKNEDAIVLDQALIVTGSGIDATIKNLKIRPTWIGEGVIEMSGGGISLGGVAEVTLNEDLEPVFNYDVTGHYRISLVGTTDANRPAGTVEQLPAMNKGDLIKFQSIGLLSNGNDILTINQKLKFYNILEMNVDQIVSGNGYFQLLGSPELGIPDLIPEQAIMEYKLDAQGGIDFNPYPIKGLVDATGYVTFELDPENQVFQDELFTSFGKLTVSPGTKEDSRAFSFSAELTRKPDECKIDFKIDNTGGNQEQDFKIGNGKNVIKVFEGTWDTKNNHTEWDYFSYKGKTSQIDGLNKPESNNILDFTVNGAIQATSSSLEVSNIDVGIGEMKLTYDFANSRLQGSLGIHNIPLGYAYLKDGQLSVLFDNNGYYLSGYADALLLNTLPAECGFIFGNSSYVDPTDVNTITHNFHNKYKPNLGTIEGFYCIGELKLIDKTVGTPLDILSVNLQAGIGSYYQGSLDDDNKMIEIGGYIYGDAWGGISVEVAGVGCSAGVGSYIHGEAKGSYYLDTHVIDLKACTQGGIRVSACGIGTGFDFHVDGNCTYNGGFDLKMDYGWSECP